MRDTVRVRAQVAPPEARAELWQRLSAMYPYFTDYQTRTSREIPIVILSPMQKAAV
jgi:hypothetical protein